jgi:Transposase DDE domain
LSGASATAKAARYEKNACRQAKSTAPSLWALPHEFLQRRRQEQGSEAFQQRMHQRNAIEGTLSELTRGHGMRRSRYRGFGKVELQNLLIGTACNIKRWLRHLTTKRNSQPSHRRMNFRAKKVVGMVL